MTQIELTTEKEQKKYLLRDKGMGGTGDNYDNMNGLSLILTIANFSKHT